MAKPKWKSIIIERDGESLTGYLHPPGSVGNTRYWAFTCKKANIERKSLKAESYAEAKRKAHDWFKKEPEREERLIQEQRILTWDEWDEIQVAHASRRGREDSAMKRALKTLEECRNAKKLFVAVTEASSVTAVDADIVARFQVDCAKRRSKNGTPFGATTIHKTLAHMSASFNRCRPSAGKRCVRGVVPAEKLLEVNPFEEVQWVEVKAPNPRQFSPTELKAFLNWKYLASCPLIGLFAKVSLWSCGRIEEMTELRWAWIDAEGYMSIPDDHAKWGKGKTVRIPHSLLTELERFKTNGMYVWSGYAEQLRLYHRTEGHHGSAHRVKEFTPERLRGVFQKWIGEWSKAHAEGLSHHAFRRTALQWSREGQLRSTESKFAKAVNLSLAVAEQNYTTKPERLWADLTYRNIAGEIGGDQELARLMGLGTVDSPSASIETVRSALDKGDYAEATRLLKLLEAASST